MANRTQLSFLPNHEGEDFAQAGRKIPRDLSERDPSSGRLEDRGVLEKVVAQQLESKSRATRQSGRSWFWCATIGVQAGDGMSWSAQTVAELVRRKYSHFRLHTLVPPSPEALPAISGLIGKRRFLRRVASAGVSNGFLPFRSWVTVLLVLAALALTGVLKYLEVGIPGGAGLQDTSPGLGVGLSFTLFAAISLGLQEVLVRLSMRRDRGPMRDLQAEIRESKISSKVVYWQLVEELKSDLYRGHFPRFLIVDDFTKLDPLTRDVLSLYIRRGSDQRPGTEAWVIFEPWTGGLSHELVIDSKKASFPADCRFYRQQLLDSEQRQKLAEIVGRPERSQFPTVKLICKADSAAERQEYADLLRMFRRDHPRREGRYDEMDLLYLLTLNARGHYEELEHRFLVDHFSKKNRKRSELLKVFLVGSDLRKEELDKALRKIATHFSDTPFLQLEDGQKRKLEVRPTGVFDEVAGELKLPAEGLGHLFWCIFWLDWLQGEKSGGTAAEERGEQQSGGDDFEAFWVRKIAYHLLKSDLMESPPEFRPDAFERTTQALVYTLEGAVETCVYEPLPDLLELAALRAESDELQERPGIRRRLRRACWNAYVLTGGEKALLSYLRTLRRSQKATRPEDPLIRLFLETIPAEEEDRLRLAQLLKVAAGSGVGPAMLPQFARQRAAVLVTRIHQLHISKVNLRVSSAIAAARQTILDDAELMDRYLSETPIGALEMTDLLTLRLLLDNLGHLVVESSEIGRLKSLLSRLTGDEGSERSQEIAEGANKFVTELAASGIREPLRKLIQLAEVAVLLGDHLGKEISRSLGSRLVRAALIRDLGAVAMINLYRAVSALDSETTSMDGQYSDLMQRICEVADTLFDSAGLSVAAVRHAGELLSEAHTHQIEQLGSLSAFTFLQFELGTHALLAETRRTELVLGVRGEVEIWKRSEPLRLALEDSSGNEPLLDVIANLVLAKQLKFSSELFADFFLRASAEVLDKKFSIDLKRDFSLLAIRTAHHLGIDLTQAVQFLLSTRNDEGLTLLEEYLVDEEIDPETDAIQLMNVAKRSSAELRSELRKSLQILLSRPDAEEKKLERLFDLEKIAAQIETSRDEVRASLDEILDDWNDRRDSWHYPSLLVSLLDVDPTERLEEEAHMVLAGANSFDDSNAYIRLSIAWAEILRSEGKALDIEEQPLSFLRQSIQRWEGSFTASGNEHAYRLLCQGYENPPAALISRLTHWTEIKLQHDEAAQVLPLLKRKSYFRLFVYYINFAEGWGLPTVDDVQDPASAGDPTKGEGRKEMVEQWIRDGSQVGSLLADDTGQTAISLRLLLIGETIFQVPYLTREDLETARKRFDLAAKRELPRLLRMTRSLPALPQPIRDLLRAHEERFKRSS